jgi:hypothetical protein
MTVGYSCEDNPELPDLTEEFTWTANKVRFQVGGKKIADISLSAKKASFLISKRASTDLTKIFPLAFFGGMSKPDMAWSIKTYEPNHVSAYFKPAAQDPEAIFDARFLNDKVRLIITWSKDITPNADLFKDPQQTDRTSYIQLYFPIEKLPIKDIEDAMARLTLALEENENPELLEKLFPKSLFHGWTMWDYNPWKIYGRFHDKKLLIEYDGIEVYVAIDDLLHGSQTYRISINAPKLHEIKEKIKNIGEPNKEASFLISKRSALDLRKIFPLTFFAGMSKPEMPWHIDWFEPNQVSARFYPSDPKPGAAFNAQIYADKIIVIFGWPESISINADFLSSPKSGLGDNIFVSKTIPQDELMKSLPAIQDAMARLTLAMEELPTANSPLQTLFPKTLFTGWSVYNYEPNYISAIISDWNFVANLHDPNISASLAYQPYHYDLKKRNNYIKHVGPPTDPVFHKIKTIIHSINEKALSKKQTAHEEGKAWLIGE